MVQRTIRWVDYVTADDPLYRAFRTLFLRLHAEPVPKGYRAALGYPEVGWDDRTGADRAQGVARIAGIHRSTHYRGPESDTL